MKTSIKEPHGRETYIVDFGDGLVMKRPLPEFSQQQKDKWLAKQHRTKDVIDGIKAVGNPVYNVPAMIHIKDDEYQLLEERAQGEPLTWELYQSLSGRQRVEIVNSIASFLVDMNELKPVQAEETHRIADEIKMKRLDNIVANKMPRWFKKDQIKYIVKLAEKVNNFEYTTCKAWSHADVNPNNVLYDAKTSKIYFIDFAEAGYNFIYRDVFSPLNIDLGICKNVYDLYVRLHNKNLYRMPGMKNAELYNIMRYRMITVWLKRFIKAGDDLRVNPQSEKSYENNFEKLFLMQDIIYRLRQIEGQLAK